MECCCMQARDLGLLKLQIHPTASGCSIRRPHPQEQQYPAAAGGCRDSLCLRRLLTSLLSASLWKPQNELNSIHRRMYRLTRLLLQPEARVLPRQQQQQQQKTPQQPHCSSLEASSISMQQGPQAASPSSSLMFRFYT